MSRRIALKPSIQKLDPELNVAAFSSEAEALNLFLHRYALNSQAAGSAQTYVARIGDAIAGYYSLTVGHVAFADAPERLAKGLPRHPVPVIILARLTVDRSWKAAGVGKGLLLDALRRTLQAADIAGVRAVVVHAKDDAARGFYAHFGFQSFASEPLVLYRLLKDLRHMLEA